MHIQPREAPVVFCGQVPLPGNSVWMQSLKSSSAVTLCLDGATLVEADLRDVTPTGFRISYVGPALPLGLEMVILYSWGKVNALVASVVHVKPGIEADFLITG